MKNHYIWISAFLIGIVCICCTPKAGPSDQEELLDMCEIIQPVPLSAAFSLEGYGVWGNSVTKVAEGEFYMFFSCVPDGLQHANSRIGYASSESPAGPWQFEGIALPHGRTWDSCYTHNPSVFKHKGKYYLYYSGHSGNLHYDKWVGVAVADHPRGPWSRFDEPLITREVDPEAERCTNNPSAIVGPDGKIWVFYSCRAKGWEAIHAVRSDNPLGPFELVEGVTGIGSREPAIKVEDAVIFKYDHIYYIIVKDKSGYYSGFGEMSNAFFYSEDGIHWNPAPNPKLFENLKEITWEGGSKEKFHKLERAQIWWDDSGKRGVLSMAAHVGSLGSGVGLGNYQAITIQIPLIIPD